ncbi:MAG: hypothetical protein JL50_04675 [Peptococcaceae bacterium BICA1-7]|nr:MAG: hypothetical protein JL50_04675 [Peptococcaceae bacterium BICA1-7]HBV95917.1 3-hydroxybutyryl-CoA dehydrogenase [Desulfotomaculum sp.]
MDYQKLIVEKENNVLVAAINNPPANAMGQGVLKDLDRLLDESLNDDSIRVIIITGTGEKLFSAGADISEFSGLQADTERINGNDVYFKIENYPKIIIAAMQGSAYGGGLELAMSCHMRFIADNAKIGLPEVKLGIMPGWGGTQRLPRYIGKTKAMELMLTGDPLTAREALNLGVVNRVVPQNSIVNEAKTFAAGLATGAPIAQREIIRAVNRGLNAPLDEGVYKIEFEGVARVFSSDDAREGAMAFFQKRPPVFKGK